MEALIEQLVRKLHSLPEVKILEVLDFVEFLNWNKERSTLGQSGNDPSQNNEEFEAIADRLADEFQTSVGAVVPVLSNYAISRTGIYEEHP
jgi:hypothetical protein